MFLIDDSYKLGVFDFAFKANEGHKGWHLVLPLETPKRNHIGNNQTENTYRQCISYIAFALLGWN